MNAPAPKPQAEQESDLYANQKWMIGEIVLAHQVLFRFINELRKQNDARYAVGQKLAAEEVSRVATQLKACADVVVRTSAEHINRRPRP